MPELPEVETTVRGLTPVLAEARLTLVEPRRPDLRHPFPADLRQRMTGATVTSLGRRAKYGLIDTDRGDTMVFHLGMSGRWRIDPGEPQRHDHLLLETDAERRLALNDPRRFGFVDLWPTAELASYPPFLAMGPEPLGPDFTADYLAQALEGRAAPIKAMLLDQRIVAGLGNIYVCEALHMARIAPGRAGGQISKARLVRLVEAIRAVLEAAILAGGSSLRDYVRPDGELGYFSKEWRVYGREGDACECGAIVRRRTDSGRSTFWCATCQRS
ncbi:bifunctional DNA-formamidopyrimidine glycosylase/DNA-(apurinic or apyrimidinic site) lyase [Sphingomonas sanguinis]|uniref:Formamidopyrimidine-DNA glycosylase n=1 Tax=Sphingomonas sanguinis TaxID=33051 RepID=A0ABU5LPB2_9SPHN|nr:bifunctional DNA-formamidopyrimidine glycosylase/DNA-(apurinic or apyrimidinic site) lyase [Sphingomonas sanguinis]MDZ7281767.1 bifunctional DNA-formamidopyrimidine glycosylase/DNA-(apurinic or apyrimidinic site) lyase [Sphingomonas sanguinis]QXT35588.1 bifunctional DNA-formamidopyrimidine glycosylase/DNA-(apurinic or apyrimidinic site) lyase [Sphingomonas sanguinis]